MVECGSKFIRLALDAESKMRDSRLRYSTLSREGQQKGYYPDDGPRPGFARHRIFGAALDAEAFFARLDHSRERGLNEQINSLVRQYFPESTDFTTNSYGEVRNVEELISAAVLENR